MTEEQTAIFGAGRTLVDGKPLTPRQQHAFDMARRSSSGVRPDEVGAALHALRQRHDEDTRCPYCEQEGHDVLRSRALKQLVTRKRIVGLYVCRNKEDALVEQTVELAAQADDGYDPQTSEIGF